MNERFRVGTICVDAQLELPESSEKCAFEDQLKRMSGEGILDSNNSNTCARGKRAIDHRTGSSKDYLDIG